LPQIPEVGTGQPDDFNLARGRFDVPSAYGAGGGGETHGAVHGTAGPVEAGAGIHTEVGNPLVDVGLHLGPGEELGLNVGLSVPSGGETLQGILGSPVLALNHIVGETVVPVVSDLTTVLSSVVNSLAGGLLGGPFASSGLIKILGSHDSGSELFSGGKYTDYHLALQAGDTAPAATIGHDAVGVGLDGGDLTGGLIPALGQITHGSGHDAGAPHIGLPSAVDELLLRGPLDIVM
jgi:hypothetical protein